MECKKHAYLIMAHKDDYAFVSLIRLLDHPLNDIFIHMDIKNIGYDEHNISCLAQYSNVYHCNRISVTWGGYSQIQAELELLSEATKKNKYLFYHLLSGQDLPIKSQKTIHSFFNANLGKEFIRFNYPMFQFDDRVCYYHLFQERLGRKKNITIRVINKAFLCFQSFCGIKRNRNIQFQKGTNWFSISDDLARYVISLTPWISEVFKYTKCCDEVFLQTIVENSSFKNKLFHKEYDNELSAIMRLIDWNRGMPYVFRIKDFDELVNSKYMFARKFDDKIDREVIEKVIDYVGCYREYDV